MPLSGDVDPALCRREFDRPNSAQDRRARSELVAIVETIIERRSGAFEPASFRDRYQDALRELVEAKTKGLATTPRAIAEPPKVISSNCAIAASLRRLPKNNNGKMLKTELRGLRADDAPG